MPLNTRFVTQAFWKSRPQDGAPMTRRKTTCQCSRTVPRSFLERTWSWPNWDKPMNAIIQDIL